MHLLLLLAGFVVASSKSECEILTVSHTLVMFFVVLMFVLVVFPGRRGFS